MNLTIGFSLLFCSSAVIVMMFGFSESMLRRRRSAMFFNMLICAAAIFSAAAVICFCADAWYPLQLCMHLLVHVGLGGLVYFYTLYLIAIIEDSEPTTGIIRTANTVLCTAMVLVWVVRSVIMFSGRADEGGAVTVGLYLTGQVLIGLLVLADVLLVIKHRKAIGTAPAFVLLSFVFIPYAFMLLEYFFPRIQVRLLSLLLPLLIIYTRYHTETERKLEQKEVDLLKSEVRLMTGRMRPHYLYNVLSTIYYLCDRDPEQAKEAINIFSDYLRETLDVMKHQELVPLSWERQALRNYLLLEKMRYGNKLHVEARSDVEDDNTFIPPLSVQPLVENAIRHGLARNKEGGLITVTAGKGPDGETVISVRDNGRGFDPATTEEGEGLLNVRERLRMLCGGKLTIKSRPGEGTTAVITLPGK